MLGKNSRAVYLNEFLQDQVESLTIPFLSAIFYLCIGDWCCVADNGCCMWHGAGKCNCAACRAAGNMCGYSECIAFAVLFS